MKINQLNAGLVAAAALLLLAACQGGDSQSEPASVEERAKARWEAMIERDFAAAWEYHTPGFRQQYQQDTFANDMSGRPVRWLQADVIEAVCESEDQCEVAVSVRYETKAPGVRADMEVSRELKDEWIRLDGQWWYVKN